MITIDNEVDNTKKRYCSKCERKTIWKKIEGLVASVCSECYIGSEELK